MNASRNNLRLQRKKRIRAKVFGSEKKPRLCVFKSLKRLEVQIINDDNGKTILHLDTIKIKAKNDAEGARKLGNKIAAACLEKKIEEIVFDRAGYKYHGKVKSLADGAREGGLKF
ncbi:MAG TPA: 50S ribosomal protein L18 [Candidatus Moranbacteria bacterium]|nr:50S ribosomal protein L18 [Candidatus Moranbacteria bacterium]